MLLLHVKKVFCRENEKKVVVFEKILVFLHSEFLKITY